VYARLAEILSGRDTSPAFAAIQAADRTAIAEILTETDQGFAGVWK
jgi:hypothetical protein